jgi:hypothetical protein
MAKIDNSTPVSLPYLKTLRLALIAKVGSIILETRHYCYHSKFCIPCRRKRLLLDAADITMRHALRWEVPGPQSTVESPADSGPLAGATVLGVIEGGRQKEIGEEFIFADERPSGVRRIEEIVGELRERGVRI